MKITKYFIKAVKPNSHTFFSAYLGDNEEIELSEFIELPIHWKHKIYFLSHLLGENKESALAFATKIAKAQIQKLANSNPREYMERCALKTLLTFCDALEDFLKGDISIDDVRKINVPPPPIPQWISYELFYMNLAVYQLYTEMCFYPATQALFFSESIQSTIESIHHSDHSLGKSEMITDEIIKQMVQIIEQQEPK